jgi:hypothetical protein
MLTPRPRDEVATQYAQAVDALRPAQDVVRTHTRTAEHLALTGVRDALGWVLGQTCRAPVTGREMSHPGPRELFSEWSAAEAIVTRSHRLPEGMTLPYVGAVEHALDWAQGHPTAATPAE